MRQFAAIGNIGVKLARDFVILGGFGGRRCTDRDRITPVREIRRKPALDYSAAKQHQSSAD
jgi:hypothetical protein